MTDIAGLLQGYLTAANRPLRLNLCYPDGVRDDVLMPQRFIGEEAVCGGFTYRVLCVADTVFLPLKEFIGLPAELQIVTDRGDLRSLSGIVTQAAAGESDGSLATYQLVLQDALSIMDKRVNTRVFRNKNEVAIIETLVSEWRQHSSVMRSAFHLQVDAALASRELPKREFTMQHNETDAAFIKRLLKRRGLAWFFVNGKPEDGGGSESTGPASHTLVLFDDPLRLKENAAGIVRFHRDASTEERDTITAWSAVRSLQAGVVTRHSWDYKNPAGTGFMSTRSKSQGDQGDAGSRLAAVLDDYRVAAPHVGDSVSDHAALGNASMAWHDLTAKCFNGEASVRDLAVGEWITVEGHPEIDTHDESERRFVILSQRILAQNNLPVDVGARVERLFNRSGWDSGDFSVVAKDDRSVRYRTSFSCVRRGVPIVPLFDPSIDLPRPQLQSAIVVGPPNEEVWCDEFGRIKVRFPATRASDHEHAHGAGSSDAEGDSAFVRVASHWAGNGPGNMHQCGGEFLPRIGSEVLIDFLGGDPDKPIVVGQLYNGVGVPPALSKLGGLPGNRYQSGIKSREIAGDRANQLRFDDTQGQISTQLASDHAHTELNLGWVTEPRSDGAASPRGEGAELRTDGHVAVRGAKGLLLSAWKRLGTARGVPGAALAREELLGLMDECRDLFASLGEYAAQHEAMQQEKDEQSKLGDRIKGWENGINTQPDAPEPAEPVVAVTGPSGIAMATPKAVVTYAGTNIDTVAQQHCQSVAGQRYTINAGRGVSIFSHGEGIRAIAHTGGLLLQSQHDSTVINAAKDVRITATEGKVSAVAKVIELISEDGSFIRVGGGGITFGSDGPLKFHGGEFKFEGASTMAGEFPKFEKEGADEQFELRYADPRPPSSVASDPRSWVGSVAGNAELRISLSDGSEQSGKSDEKGHSKVIQRDAMHMARVVVTRGGGNNG